MKHAPTRTGLRQRPGDALKLVIPRARKVRYCEREFIELWLTRDPLGLGVLD